MAKFSFSEGLKKLFGMHTQFDDAFFENLTDTLVEGDIGAHFAFEIEDILRNECKKQKITDNRAVLQVLYEILLPFLPTASFMPASGKTSIYLLLGVNGVGKTTSAAKMAHYFRSRISEPIILAAADTFRAAAIEQLEYHGKQLDIRVVSHQYGGDPGAVIFDAAQAAQAKGGGLVIADTAGRLHNKENLVRELQKIHRIAESKADEGCYKKIMVLDATAGQSGLRQAEVFHEAVGLDAVILTKYDSTAKGGAALSVGKQLEIPVIFIGTGEKYGDFSVFNAETYLKEFIGIPV
ncbi:MAG: signal recognition particle-docking protein FtsY [Treponema sp.]